VNSITETWLPTPAAAVALGCSQSHLKRSRDIDGGSLEGGIDYCLGSSSNAPITWHIERCRAKFHTAGLLARKANAVLRAEQEVTA
jgi:hypothetical protein